MGKVVDERKGADEEEDNDLNEEDDEFEPGAFNDFPVLNHV